MSGDSQGTEFCWILREKRRKKGIVSISRSIETNSLYFLPSRTLQTNQVAPPIPVSNRLAPCFEHAATFPQGGWLPTLSRAPLYLQGSKAVLDSGPPSSILVQVKQASPLTYLIREGFAFNH